MRDDDRGTAADASPVASGRLWVASALVALVGFVLASLMESELSYLLTYPGVLLTWPFWPEGIHTGSGGVASAVGFYGVFVLGNLLTWTVLIRVVLLAAFRLRRSPTR